MESPDWIPATLVSIGCIVYLNARRGKRYPLLWVYSKRKEISQTQFIHHNVVFYSMGIAQSLVPKLCVVRQDKRIITHIAPIIGFRWVCECFTHRHHLIYGGTCRTMCGISKQMLFPWDCTMADAWMSKIGVVFGLTEMWVHISVPTETIVVVVVRGNVSPSRPGNFFI